MESDIGYVVCDVRVVDIFEVEMFIVVDKLFYEGEEKFFKWWVYIEEVGMFEVVRGEL